MNELSCRNPLDFDFRVEQSRLSFLVLFGEPKNQKGDQIQILTYLQQLSSLSPKRSTQQSQKMYLNLNLKIHFIAEPHLKQDIGPEEEQLQYILVHIQYTLSIKFQSHRLGSSNSQECKPYSFLYSNYTYMIAHSLCSQVQQQEGLVINITLCIGKPSIRQDTAGRFQCFIDNQLLMFEPVPKLQQYKHCSFQGPAVLSGRHSISNKGSIEPKRRQSTVRQAALANCNNNLYMNGEEQMSKEIIFPIKISKYLSQRSVESIYHYLKIYYQCIQQLNLKNSYEILWVKKTQEKYFVSVKSF